MTNNDSQFKKREEQGRKNMFMILVIVLALIAPLNKLACAFEDDQPKKHPPLTDSAEKPKFYNGRVLISKNFNYNSKNVALTFEVMADYGQIYYQQLFTQELMANGYSVIERVQFDKILQELVLDQTGAIKARDSSSKESNVKDAMDKDTANKEPYLEKEISKKEYSKKDLKKLGEMLGVSYLVAFALVPHQRIHGLLQSKNDDLLYVRFINLETAEIDVSVTLTADRPEFSDISIIRSVVQSIVVSQKLKSSVKELFINFFRTNDDYEKSLIQVQASQILYHEAFPKNYAIVYIR